MGRLGRGFPGGCAARASRFSRRWRALSRSGRCSASGGCSASMDSHVRSDVGVELALSQWTPGSRRGGFKGFLVHAERGARRREIRAIELAAEAAPRAARRRYQARARRRHRRLHGGDAAVRTPTARTPHPSRRSTTSRLSSSQPTPPACRSRSTRSATRRAASPSTPSSTPTP